MFAKSFAPLRRWREHGPMLHVRASEDAVPQAGALPLPGEPFAGRQVPPDKRVYAIGDVHGCADQFEHLLDLIARDSCGIPTRDTVIVLLGDLIDRGPASCRVLQLVSLMRAGGLQVEAIMGNHEEVLLELLSTRTAQIGSFFMRVGGRETLLSYGAQEDLIDRLPDDAVARAAEICVPPEHVDLLSGFTDAVEFGDYFLTHAGIDPARALEDQDTSALRWIREPFIGWSGRKDKTVIHGHTMMPEVSAAPGRVGIDTGAYLTGRLTALVLDAEGQRLLQTPATD